MQAMTKDQAEREYYTLEDAYKSKHPNVSMIRDSWDGGMDDQVHAFGNV